MTCASLVSRAQFSAPLHLGVKDGLPTAATYCAVQDREGFIWIGTEAGLVRYDGTNFQTFTRRDGLPDNEVLGLEEDTATGKLWIITFSRSACYYYRGKIYTPANDPRLKVIKGQRGEFISGNISNGRMYLYNGSLIYECYDDTIISHDHMASLDRIPLQVQYWGKGRYDIFDINGITATTAAGQRKVYAEGRNDTVGSVVWLGRIHAHLCRARIVFYRKGSDDEYHKEATIELPGQKNVTKIRSVDGGYVFYLDGSGVYSLDTGYHTLQHIWSGTGSGSVFVDRDGNIWITTGYDGVFVLKKSKVTNYHVLPGNEGASVTCVRTGPDSSVYIGASTGSIFVLRDGEISPAPFHATHNAPIKEMIINDSAVYIVSNAFEIANLHTGQTHSFHLVSGGPKVARLLQDHRTILVGFVSALFHYDIISGEGREILARQRIFDIAQRKDGAVAIAALDGLYYFEQDTFRKANIDDKVVSGRLSSICYTPDDLLWVGTPSDGIIVCRGPKVLSRISAEQYSAYHGAMCRRILSVRDGEVWAATNYGVNKILYHMADTLVVDNIIPYSTADGLLSNDVYDIAIRDSVVYLATADGLSLLPDRNLNDNSNIPVYIMAVRIMDHDSAIHETPYVLDHTQNDLRIDYIGVSMPTGDNLTYQYRLLGAGNDAWTTTTNTSIEFRSLSAGEYTFEVAVLDKFGQRSVSVGRVRFRISPAFYTTWWFWAIIMITILVIGFLIIRDRFRRQQQRFEKEQSLHNKIIELEQQALKAQMNPHFIFNCLTAVQHFVNSEDMYSANMYLSNFARLIRKTLDLSGEQYITLDQEIAYLQDYVQMEHLRFGDKFTWQIDLADDVDSFEVHVPPMLLQPIVENAIRHGLRNIQDRTGLLRISFAMHDRVLHCIVEDDGIGRQKAKELKSSMHVEYQSKGMSLTEMRIQAINQISDKKISIEIVDKYEEASTTGTIVKLLIAQ